MKFKPLTIILLLLCMTTVSCIKDEAPNAEADIETATIEHAASLLNKEPTVGGDYVTFRLKAYAENYNFAPKFTLSPGATIEPTSGTERDFSEPQSYIVTSEDGEWQKTYQVSFTVNASASLKHSFENVDIVNTENPEGHYDQFFEYLPNGQKTYDWASGNEGYNILAASLVPEGQELTPAFYPTLQTPNGFEGKGAKLQTKETGPLGSTVGSPLAAGNLFLGDFVLTFPAIKSPRFGQPYQFDSAPVALKGYFKYKSGDDFIVNTEPSELSHDTWDAYAILFEKTESNNYLPGDHNFEDPRMISVAHISDDQRIESDEWTEFNIPFRFIGNKTYDSNKAYMYTIVFTSSKEGDIFNGAVGSTLWIDEVELITENTEK